MRSSVPKVLTSQNEAKPTNVSESKTPTCQNESRPLNERFIEPTRLSEDQEHIIKASGGVLARNSRPAAEEIEKCIRPSVIKSLVLARQNEAKPQSVSDSKTPTCPKESRPLNVMPLGRNRRPACVNCRKAKVSIIPTFQITSADSCYSVAVHTTRTAKRTPRGPWSLQYQGHMRAKRTSKTEQSLHL